MLNRGSEWRRWEPHIHAPGTVMNNQFSGPNAWDDYLTALEQATPIIEAIAVTDYYVTDTYREVLRHRDAGRLPNTALIFPNVEVRLDVATSKGGFVNLHLFVSPEDPQHIEELQRLLSRLQFNAMQDRFDCTHADLIRLGKKADPDITDDGAALAYGASQFKVNFQQLREVYAESGWAKKNILIGVAGGANDGTSGVREAADQTIRMGLFQQSPGDCFPDDWPALTDTNPNSRSCPVWLSERPGSCRGVRPEGTGRRRSRPRRLWIWGQAWPARRQRSLPRRVRSRFSAARYRP